ncbi:rhomboid family intramembrane serine protease [Halovenus sp. WSH3]|uniref:Rhomboid family intramembrane serine protease n=1 Tax=Halovenus carboxidivorans TaxID=2692199 RepID=A0A6B0T9S7_9EURY|nr:rhomboid family intramembrane serine protease [Halovenus carboxidivorans]MXR52112.1 rhomboid family intramembrane serine protease [Halovenus carboxidivorans]
MSDVLGIDETILRVGSLAVLAVALLVSVSVLSRIEGRSRLFAGPRERFVFGIPWGTALVVVSVVAVYYLVQGGGKPGGPIVSGFRSWSLWYPQGILFSSFAHFNDAHLTGNMVGTVAFAPVAEYVWRHYPDDPDLSGWRGNPHARIGVFVAAVVSVGVLGSVVVPGAVIGFSGVVFAFAGFTIVTAPIETVFAIVAIQVVRLLHSAVTDPFVVAQAQEQFVRPSWANIAVQGHLYGLVVGVLLGVALLRYRDREPNLFAVFGAALVFAVSRSLQSVYWFLGNETYVLFTAIGAAGVFVLATIIAVAACNPGDSSLPVFDVSGARAATGILVALLLGLAVIGIPYNLVPVDGGPATADGSGIEVRDYTLTYAENVDDQYIGALEIPGVWEPSVSRSGVIVTSTQRNSWGVAISAQELATRRSATVALGDATWRETVEISRTGWEVAGSNSTYKVYANRGDGWQELYAADPVTANLLINDSTITIRPADEFYELVVERDGERIGVEQIPGPGGKTTIGSIQFSRNGSALLARHEGTVVQIAAFRS